MFKNLFREPDRCKTCRSRLADENKQIGFCRECAEKEVLKIKKRMTVSTAAGVVLVITVFLMLNYAHAMAFIPDDSRYAGSVFIPTFFGYLTFNMRAFEAMTRLSPFRNIFLGLICFFLPFASYVKLDFNSIRDKAEMDLYRLEPLSGGQSASAGGPRLDGVGMFVISVLLSIVSGPFFFAYKMFKFRQLSDYLKT